MRSRLGHKKDDNHNELASVFASMGCTVLDLSAMGEGCPDVLVGAGQVNVLVEFKAEADKAKGIRAGKLTPAQVKFFAEWRGPKAEVCNAQECIDLVNRIRRGQ